MSEGQGSMRMPASSNQDQSQSNMVKPSKEDYELMFELLWPYRDYFPGSRFLEVVREIAAEYGRRGKP